MRIVDEENNCGKGGKVESKNRAKNEMAVAEEEEEVDTQKRREVNLQLRKWKVAFFT